MGLDHQLGAEKVAVEGAVQSLLDAVVLTGLFGCKPGARMGRKPLACREVGLHLAECHKEVPHSLHASEGGHESRNLAGWHCHRSWAYSVLNIASKSHQQNADAPTQQNCGFNFRMIAHVKYYYFRIAQVVRR